MTIDKAYFDGLF